MSTGKCGLIVAFTNFKETLAVVGKVTFFLAKVATPAYNSFAKNDALQNVFGEAFVPQSVLKLSSPTPCPKDGYNQKKIFS